jgi:hypothetical protein
MIYHTNSPEETEAIGQLIASRLQPGTIIAFEGDGNVFSFEGSYSDYEENKMRRLGIEEPKKARYRKLMED